MTLEELESFVDEWDNSQRQQGPLNDAGFAKLATRYRAGETLLRLANDAGVPRTRLRRALIAAGVPMHPLRRLSVATVEDLEGRYLAGKSLRDLAVETGIPYSTIREALIAAGVTMRHGATATSRSSSP
jgi:lambda repressor-like predicted transcriptional regulator